MRFRKNDERKRLYEIPETALMASQGIFDILKSENSCTIERRMELSQMENTNDHRCADVCVRLVLSLILLRNAAGPMSQFSCLISADRCKLDSRESRRTKTKSEYIRRSQRKININEKNI